jgi:hypothetical protein
MLRSLQITGILSRYCLWTELQEGLTSYYAFCSGVAGWKSQLGDKNLALLILCYHGGQLLMLFLFLGYYTQQQLNSEFF